MAVHAYIAALANLQDNNAKQFIIKQLQQIGKDESVPALKPYLTDDHLAGPAARALAQINTPSSADVLLKALATAKGNAQLSIIEALGYAEYKPAADAILPIATTATDVQLKKISLYALARIGSPASAATLQKAAQQAGYTYDYTEAVTAYILYLHRLAANGNSTQAETAATQLFKDASTAGRVHTKIAALQILTEIKGTASLPLLKAAMLDKDIKYRGAALSFATKLRSPATDKQWLQLLPTLNAGAQVQLINFLGQSDNESLQLGLQKLLKNKNSDVRVAAILASSKVGGKAALPVLLEVLKIGDTADVAAVKTALLTLKSNDIAIPMAKVLKEMPPAGKVALLQVLAARGATSASHEIFFEVRSTDTSVHNAAIAALPAVVTQDNLHKLYGLLNAAKPSDVANLQLAIAAASASITDTASRTDTILAALNAAPADKQYLYYNVLGTIGGKAALGALQAAYVNGGAEAKLADVSALAKTNSAGAARILLAIAQQPGAGEDALNGYISIIQNGNLPSDQKLLMLKEAMAVATTDTQRKSIIVEAGECRTFLALVFAGKYLDYAAVQQEAAHAVMDIALSNNEFTGDIVINLLNKVADVLTGRDADYEKQSIRKHIADITGKPGFTAMFNGTDLTGWKGLVENPIVRAKMNPDTLAAAQAKADKIANDGWFAKDGLLVFSGHGENLCTVKQYGDFEMFVDWKITKEGDAGIYLRGSPQVQIWDTSRRSVGAEVGSGGLYNNQKYQSKPLVLADNAIGEWNSFHIIMRGDKVTVYLNGVLVTDNVVLENYWDRSLPIFIKEQIELQAHGTYVAYRDLYIKELSGSAPFVMSNEEKKDGFSVLFDGSNLDQWTGNTIGYKIDQGSILVDTADGHPGNMYTKQRYSDFVLRFEFQLTPGANNGIGIRAPLEGDAAYVGMEIQVLDNEADEYKDLHAYQYHGSVYGVIPAKRGFLKPTGQWNYEEITAQGPHIKVVLNGEVILDGNIDEASKNGTADKREHPGLHNPSGHIGFLGHGSVVRFRNLRIREL
jgi:HEAT repeat protein